LSFLFPPLRQLVNVLLGSVWAGRINLVERSILVDSGGRTIFYVLKTKNINSNLLDLSAIGCAAVSK
jgi:hypothetical protein